jgi:hypothetical protein
MAHANTLVCALERQVSRGDNYNEDVNHRCNLGCPSKYDRGHYYACDIEYHKQSSPSHLS